MSRASNTESPAGTTESARPAAPSLTADALPPALAGIVRETVRRTRLRRSERQEIERELVSHLLEGLDAGTAVDTLARSFGDPTTVAPLLRRTTIARRHPADRAAYAVARWGSAILAVLVVLYLALATRLWLQRPVVRFDARERIVASIPEATSEPAWPLYRTGLSWLMEERRSSGPAGAAPPSPPSPSELAEAALDPHADPERRRAAEAMLEQHADELDMIRLAARRPVLGFEPTHRLEPEDEAFFYGEFASELEASTPAADDVAIGIQLPYLGTLNISARLLAADAQLALERGDGERATENVEAILGIADHAEQPPLLVNQLVGSALRALAVEMIMRAVESHPASLTDEQLDRLDRVLAGIDESTFQLQLDVERTMLDDVVQRSYTDDGEGDGVLDPSAFSLIEGMLRWQDPTVDRLAVAQRELVGFLAGPAVSTVAAGRRETMDLADRLTCLAESEARDPLWMFEDRAGTAMKAAAEEGNGWRHPLLRLVLPVYARAIVARRIVEPHRDASRLAIALERHRRAHGAWPSTLDALVPEQMSRLPVDPFSGDALGYRVVDGWPRVWSVGHDRVNDGGVGPFGAVGRAATASASQWVSAADAAEAVAAGRSGPPVSGVLDRYGMQAPRVVLGDWILIDAPDAAPEPGRGSG